MSKRPPEGGLKLRLGTILLRAHDLIKTTHVLHNKILTKLEKERTYIYIIKAVYGKHTANVMPNEKPPNKCTECRKKTRVSIYCPFFIQFSPRSLSWDN